MKGLFPKKQDRLGIFGQRFRDASFRQHDNIENQRVGAYRYCTLEDRGVILSTAKDLIIEMKNHNYFVYITTNKSRKVLYTGMTNNLRTRLQQHEQDALGEKKTFAGKYNCYFLVYWERHQYVNHAIEREKEIKGWKRFKKENLINSINPDWKFLNNELG